MGDRRVIRFGNGGAAASALSSIESNNEILISRGEVSLCLLLNRRTATMRIIDFRSGAQHEKLELVQEVAEAEQMRRAFIVVEREEATTWTRLGFVKEGHVPGFYRRSDAHVLGMSIDALPPRESAVRIRLEPKQGTDRLERAYQAARRSVRARAGAPLPRVKVSKARPRDETKAFEQARLASRDLTDFAPFGRDTERRSILLTARGGFSVLVGVEVQLCFGNAFLELLTGPRGEKETWMIAGGLDQLAEQLAAEDLEALFSVTPAASVEMSALMVAAGFRKTGRLSDHLLVDGQAHDALLWSRKLAEG